MPSLLVRKDNTFNMSLLLRYRIELTALAQWSESGAHNLLQVRTKVLNDQLRETFVRWYPGMQSEQETEIEKKAA